MHSLVAAEAPLHRPHLAKVEVRARLAVEPIPRMNLLVAVRAGGEELRHVRIAQVIQNLKKTTNTHGGRSLLSKTETQVREATKHVIKRVY